jgi:hypothetical protein
MIPLRLVVDTNIVVSAALKADELQRTVLLLAITRPARLYVSSAFSLNIGTCCHVQNSSCEKAFDSSSST